MALQTSTHFSDIERVVNKLRSVEAAARHLEPAMEEIGKDLFTTEQTLFNSQGRRGGGSWAPNKPSTLKKKKNPQILIESGRLLDSLTIKGHEDQIFHITENSIVFGTTAPGSRALFYGNPANNLRARPFIRPTFSDRSRWGLIISRHIVRTWHGS